MQELKTAAAAAAQFRGASGDAERAWTVQRYLIGKARVGEAEAVNVAHLLPKADKLHALVAHLGHQAPFEAGVQAAWVGLRVTPHAACHDAARAVRGAIGHDPERARLLLVDLFDAECTAARTPAQAAAYLNSRATALRRLLADAPAALQLLERVRGAFLAGLPARLARKRALADAQAVRQGVAAGHLVNNALTNMNAAAFSFGC